MNIGIVLDLDTEFFLAYCFPCCFNISTGPLYPGLPFKVAASGASFGSLPRAFVAASVPGQAFDQRQAEWPWLGHDVSAWLETHGYLSGNEQFALEIHRLLIWRSATNVPFPMANCKNTRGYPDHYS